MGRFQVALEHVKFYAYHGVGSQERKIGNEFQVDLSVEYDEAASPLDEAEGIENLVSYADLYELVKEEMDEPRLLLETVAKAISERVKENYPFVDLVSCRITKLTPPICGFDGSASVRFIN